MYDGYEKDHHCRFLGSGQKEIKEFEIDCQDGDEGDNDEFNLISLLFASC